MAVDRPGSADPRSVSTKEPRMIIVAGVDDTPVAREVVTRAAEQASRWGAELHLVHVTYVPTVYSYVPMGYAEVPIDRNQLAAAEREAVWSVLDGVIAGLSVPVERVDLDGYPPDTLVDYTKNVGAALLVVGTRGRGDFASLILGSTSHRAIHLAPCDVLVVKATA
jgi:nucleotide-binding universal stress UspA family protein